MTHKRQKAAGSNSDLHKNQLTKVNCSMAAPPRRKLSPEQISQVFEAALCKVASRPRPTSSPAYHWPDLGPAPAISWALPWMGA